MATVPRILTYDEWLQTPAVEDGREEVVHGESFVIPPNRYTRAEIVRRLTKELSTRIDEQAARVFGSSISLLISRDPLTCRAPDVLVYRREQIVRDENDVLCSAPDLVIEILSPSETKRRKQQKLDDYARIGVPEVWIVSPEAQSVEIHLFAEGRFTLSRILVEGEIAPTRFPNANIPIHGSGQSNCKP